jgi:hypothetical protein
VAIHSKEMIINNGQRMDRDLPRECLFLVSDLDVLALLEIPVLGWIYRIDLDVSLSSNVQASRVAS